MRLNDQVDGLAPKKVLKPTSLDELSATLADAHSASEAVIPWGGGSRMHVGNIPERYDTALDLTGISSKIEHEPGDLTVVANAGVQMSDLQSRLAEAGQRLPFEVFHPEKATLGGSVASDSHGHMRSSTGGIRDWVIGMKVVLADGTVTKSGGRVVKNVQGFDLHRLHTGAYGTLGVIAEVALKLAPLPSRTRTIAAWFDSVESVQEMAKQVFNGPAIPEAITAFIGNNARNALAQISTTDEAEVLLLARSAGGTALVDRQVSDLTGLAGTLDARGYEVIDGTEADALWAAASTELQDGLSLVARCTLRPGSAFSFIAETMKETEQFSGEVHCGFGTALSGYPADDATRALVDSVRRAAEKFGGAAVFERCPHHLKQEIDVFGDPGASIEVMRSVKGRFDPKRVLNPGRFAGGI